MPRLTPLQEETPELPVCPPGEDTERVPSAVQEESSHQERRQSVPPFRTSSLQNCETVNWLSKPPVHGILPC